MRTSLLNSKNASSAVVGSSVSYFSSANHANVVHFFIIVGVSLGISVFLARIYF